MSASPTLGPVVGACVLAPDFDRARAAYCRDLRFEATPPVALHAAEARRLDLDALAGARQCHLGPAGGPAWLHLVEAPRAAADDPLRRCGWMAVEVLVDDPDALVAMLGPDWTVLGPPADLAFSAAIRATQVLGPCGELYYFTAVRGEVPPFELPRARHFVDAPFIGVLSCTDADLVGARWTEAGAAPAIRAQTRVTVLSRALGEPGERPWPLAIVQLAGRCLVEIDEVSHPAHAPEPAPGLRTGVHLLSFEAGAGREAGLWYPAPGARVLLVPRAVGVREPSPGGGPPGR